jgi:predicted Zn-dependent protease
MLPWILTGALLFQSAAIVDKAERAKTAMSSRRFDEAAKLYSELVRELPSVPGMKMNLGMAFFYGGRPKEAVRHLSLAVQADPSLTPAWLYLGTAQLETGQPGEALKSLERYLKESPGDPQALQVLGDTLLRLEQYPRAVQNFEQLTQKAPGSPRAWYGLGRSYEGLAGRTFSRLEKMAPESGYWFALIADSRAAQKQYSSAYFFYRKALEKSPGLRGIHVAISRIYRETQHEDWAQKEEQKEIALGIPDCGREPLVCDFLNGRLRAVIESAQKLDSPENCYWLIQASNQLALGAFGRLAQLPSSHEVHELRAEIHRNQGRHWESVIEWQKALEIAPDDPRIRRELAFALYLKRDYAAAKPRIQELLRTNPQSGELNYLAGDILLYEQKPAEALPWLEKAVRLSPDLLGAHSALGRACMSLGEAERAIPHLKKALAMDDDGSIHFQLARAYQRTGNEQLAAESMAKYQEITRSLKLEQAKLSQEVKITPP